MPSKAFTEFRDNIKDVDNIISAHLFLNNGEKGKKGLGHITRSGIVMLCATWELYIESLLIESLNILLKGKITPKDLPTIVKKTLSQKVKDDKNHLKPIELAGDGWRNTLIYYSKIETDNLNTPKSEKINNLYNKYLGLVEFSSRWTIDPNKLDSFVSKRGDIAHKGRKANYIKIGDLKSDRQIIFDLVTECDIIILDYLKRLDSYSKQPWRKTY